MEIRTVRFDDGTEVTVVRDGDRIYIDDKSVKKQSNRHVMSHTTYVHNVVIREDTENNPTLTETEEE